jgi:hypothetical protein
MFVFNLLVELHDASSEKALAALCLCIHYGISGQLPPFFSLDLSRSR